MSWRLLFFFFLMIRRPPRSTHCISSAASDVYKRQINLFFLFFLHNFSITDHNLNSFLSFPFLFFPFSQTNQYEIGILYEIVLKKIKNYLHVFLLTKGLKGQEKSI
eukprot:TRINITY_DN7357_c0_g1_i1.p2 TRINITY_DN7357_c0_g1~~TRINITY_DN7357_c0_g1_i1.p2  ORF type:complete len:106 (+),score=23.63 TRINITY_DN7357_c0_g1_i1:56-373(+)